MTNIVVNFPNSQAYYNLFGYILKGTSVLTNVHMIAGSGKYARMHDNTVGYIKAESTVTFHTNLEAFNTAEKTLTDFLTFCVKKYLFPTIKSDSGVPPDECSIVDW